ncbi:MAG: hypothetical protein KDG44_14220, partial [Burkholderiaceae bacterium]|nr:hypothetical protein [Burkholderiaceae bacterium]
MSRPDASPSPSASPDPAVPGLAWPEHAWQLRLLGRPCLASVPPGRTIVLRPKDAALLAVVALSGGIKADHLSAMLWPGASARQ